MKEKILEFLTNHPGARKREIASFLKIWLCDSEFIRIINEMQRNGFIRYEVFNDPANMEYYNKWYVVN